MAWGLAFRALAGWFRASPGSVISMATSETAAKAGPRAVTSTRGNAEGAGAHQAPDGVRRTLTFGFRRQFIAKAIHPFATQQHSEHVGLRDPIQRGKRLE